MVNNELIVVGVDVASSRAAFVALRGTEFFTMAVTKLGSVGGEACAGASSATHEFLDQLPWPITEPVEVFVEWPVLGRGGFRSTIVQAFTNGAVQGTFHERGCVTQGANVSSWKKAISSWMTIVSSWNTPSWKTIVSLGVPPPPLGRPQSPLGRQPSFLGVS